MRHSRSQVSPAVRLVLDGDKFLALAFGQNASRRAFKGFQIENRLLAQTRIQKTADFQVFANRFVNRFHAHIFGNRFDHHGVEPRVLSFFEPVISEQAFKLRVEPLVVADALDIMPLRHPFDMQNH